MKTKATDLLLSSQTSCRVLLIGIVLSCLHTAGILGMFSHKISKITFFGL